MLDIIMNWLGIAAGYLIGGTLIAGGAYLAFVLGSNPLNPFAKLLHAAGIGLVILGVIIVTLKIGETNGARTCEAQRKDDILHAQINKLKLEAAAKETAASTSAQQAQTLAEDNAQKQLDIESYKAQTEKLSAAVAACRMLTDDDARRLRDITGQPGP